MNNICKTLHLPDRSSIIWAARLDCSRERVLTSAHRRRTRLMEIRRRIGSPRKRSRKGITIVGYLSLG